MTALTVRSFCAQNQPNRCTCSKVTGRNVPGALSPCLVASAKRVLFGPFGQRPWGEGDISPVMCLVVLCCTCVFCCVTGDGSQKVPMAGRRLGGGGGGSDCAAAAVAAIVQRLQVGVVAAAVAVAVAGSAGVQRWQVRVVGGPGVPGDAYGGEGTH